MTNENETLDLRRSDDGSVNMNYYLTRARRLRRLAIRRIVRTMGHAFPRQLGGAWAAFNELRARRATYRELSRLGRRELADIGLTPADMQAIGTGAYFRDDSRRPRPAVANDPHWIERSPPGVHGSSAQTC